MYARAAYTYRACVRAYRPRVPAAVPHYVRKASATSASRPLPRSSIGSLQVAVSAGIIRIITRELQWALLMIQLFGPAQVQTFIGGLTVGAFAAHQCFLRRASSSVAAAGAAAQAATVSTLTNALIDGCG